MPSTTTTASTTAKSSSYTSSSPPKRRLRLSNTNTDTLCTDSDSFFLQKWIYRFNLWTGLYMLNPYERLAFHIVGWFSLTVSLLYIYVFWTGFIEGVKSGTGTSSGGVGISTTSGFIVGGMTGSEDMGLGVSGVGVVPIIDNIGVDELSLKTVPTIDGQEQDGPFNHFDDNKDDGSAASVSNIGSEKEEL